MNMQELNKLRRRQIAAVDALRPLMDRVARSKELEASFQQIEKEIARLNDALKEDSSEIEESLTDIHKKDLPAPERELRIKRFELSEELADIEWRLDLKPAKATSESPVASFYAGNANEVDAKKEQNLKELIRECSKRAKYLRIPRPIEGMDFNDLVDLLESASEKYKYADAEEERKAWAYVMGRLNGAGLAAWRKELVPLLEVQQPHIEELATQHGAVETDATSCEWTKLYEEVSPASDRKKVGFAMVAGEIHGRPSFVMNRLRALGQPHEVEAREYLEIVRTLNVAMTDISVAMSAVSVAAKTRHKGSALRDRVIAQREATGVVSDWNTIMADVEEETARAQQKMEEMNKRFEAAVEVSELELPDSEVIAGVQIDGVAGLQFSLPASVAAVESADGVKCYCMSHLPTVSEQEGFVTFIGKKPAMNREGEITEQYFFCDATGGRHVFDAAKDLQTFMDAYFRYKAKSAGVQPPKSFSLEEINLDGLQRCMDMRRIPYNWPRDNQRVSTWITSELKESIESVKKISHKDSANTSQLPNTGADQNSHDFLVVMEPAVQCWEAMLIRYGEHANETTCLAWNPDHKNEYEVLAGKKQPIDSNSRVYLMGYERSLSDISLPSSPGPLTGQPGRATTSGQSEPTEDPVSEWRDPMRTVAGQLPDELSEKFDSLVHTYNAAAIPKPGAPELDESERVPGQINIDKFDPITGSNSMVPFESGFTAGLKKRKLNVEVKVRHVDHVVDVSAKDYTGKVDKILLGSIVVRKWGRSREDARQTILVSDVNTYKKGDLVNVKRKGMRIEVTKTLGLLMKGGIGSSAAFSSEDVSGQGQSGKRKARG